MAKKKQYPHLPRWVDIWVYNPMQLTDRRKIIVKIKIERHYRNSLWVWEV